MVGWWVVYWDVHWDEQMVDWKGTQKVALMEMIPAAMTVVCLDGHLVDSRVEW